ncbi:MAG: hypothetical protein HYW90_03470 [Candidatus Sungbacteria bacterium]|nr:hypothetical protein [Candidatus Sungbacteria bacterium]
MTFEASSKNKSLEAERVGFEKKDGIRQNPERLEAIRMAVTSEIDEEMRRLHEGEPFHNEAHPRNVFVGANEILDIIERYCGVVNQEERLATEAAAKGHDLVINYSIETDPGALNFGQRLRHRGFGEFMPPGVRSRPEVAERDGVKKGNEELSWLRVQEIILRHDPAGEVYTPAAMEEIRTAIGVTYPDVQPFAVSEQYRTVRDPETGEVIELTDYLGKGREEKPSLFLFDQPLLKPESRFAAVAVAFGDLLYGGRCDAARFRSRGNEEYREVNSVISAIAEKDIEKIPPEWRRQLPAATIGEIAGGRQTLSSERKAAIARSAMNWISSQVGFLLGQKIRFESLLQNLYIINESRDPEGLRQELNEYYRNFDPNIVDATRRADYIRQQFGDLADSAAFISSADADRRFEKLLQEMGYPPVA